MAAEIIAALIVIKEAADTVTSVANAIQSVKDLYDSFQGRDDKTNDLKEFIRKVKEIVEAEVQGAELQGYLGTVSAACETWYRASGKIRAISTMPTKEVPEVQKRDAEFRAVSEDPNDELSELAKAIDYFKSGRPKPQTPSMLSVYCTTFTIRTAMSFTDTAIFSITSGVIDQDELRRSISEIEDAKSFIRSACEIYKAYRASQLQMRAILETEFIPPRISGYKVASDSGGDSLIPNLRGEIFSEVNKGWHLSSRVIEFYWKESDFGRESVPYSVPALLTQLDSTMMTGELKLKLHQ